MPVKRDRARKGMEVGRVGDVFRAQLDCGVDFTLCEMRPSSSPEAIFVGVKCQGVKAGEASVFPVSPNSRGSLVL